MRPVSLSLIHIFSEGEREELNNTLGKPLLLLGMTQVKGEESQEMAGMLSAGDKLDEMPESIVTQAAVAFVQAEYEAMGMDMDAMQMDYIKKSGTQMLLLAFVIMVASICVTFLSARVAAALGHDLRNSTYRKVCLLYTSGFAVKSQKMGEKEYKVIIEVKKEETAEAKEEEISCAADTRSDTVVVISSSRMGEGKDDLGEVLMKGFIYALTQQDTLPKTILFYNGGAILTCEGSQALEDLRTMEAQGVKILTCGTCLNYYGPVSYTHLVLIFRMYFIWTKRFYAETATGAFTENIRRGTKNSGRRSRGR